ncbi:MAG: DUF4830 domain-containing protein [Clostridia bacterium]|nr:DUF4830 domain-containing protein [Clostridia bacterium]
MFICTVRANTLKLFAVIAVSVIALAAIILSIPEYTPTSPKSIAVSAEKYNYEKIKTVEDVAEFLAQFGWEVEATPLEEVKIRIPEEFDKVMNAYNELQRNQGLDLSKYKGREVTRYTFKITNYPDYKGSVMANVIVYKKRVIGGDICSTDVTGFIYGFDGNTKAK